MHGSSMECSRIHSRVGLEFHHLLQIPSGSSPISVSCAGKLNKKINALCLFSLKVEPTESILKVWYFIPRDVSAHSDALFDSPETTRPGQLHQLVTPLGFFFRRI